MLDEELNIKIDDVIKWVKDYIKKAGAKGIVVGLSGGKDSAVVTAIAVKAIRKRKCCNSRNALLINRNRFRRCYACCKNI